MQVPAVPQIMARKSIRLFDEHNSFLHWISPADAQEKVASAAYEEVYRVTDNTFIGIRKRSTHRSSQHHSPCSITARESQAAVGAGRIGVYDEDGILRADESEQERAQHKIADWPTTVGHVDDKGQYQSKPRAVTVCAGKVFQPLTPPAAQPAALGAS